MIVPREMMDLVLAQPFRPFRIHMASGKAYDVRHPEVVKVGRSTITISTPMLDDEDEGNGIWKTISLMLVESVEPSESANSRQD